MRVTVCQLPDPPSGFEEAWLSLAAHLQKSGSEFVLLPELPFHAWVGWTDRFALEDWESAVVSHLEWIERLGELGVASVAGSRPFTTESGDRHNRAFIWVDGVLSDGHDKYYLPEEPGFWEASWYAPGDGSFDVMSMGQHATGFMICTDIWFTEHARGYARQGAELLLVPRATELRTTDKWIAGGQAASVMSGAFGLSSNRCGSFNGVTFGGTGWVIDPDGAILGLTTDDEPFLTVDIDLNQPAQAKATYPRYVKE